MAKVTTTEIPLFTCRACKREVTGTLSIEFDGINTQASDNTVSMTGKIRGLRVDHNCIPKVTR